MLKLITIDFWNTLFDSSDGRKRNAHRQSILIKAMDRSGRLVRPNEFDEAIQKSWAFFNRIWKDEQRTPAPKEMVTYLFKQLDINPDENTIDEIIDEYAHSILKYPPKLLPGAKENIAKLSDKFTIALVSDTGFTPGKVLKELMFVNGVAEYFSAFSFSDETGVSKPHKKAFEKVLIELEVQPEEALHIGDIEQTDILGAYNIGMRSIRFSGDPTAFLNTENTKITKAVADTRSWDEIYDVIMGLE